MDICFSSFDLFVLLVRFLLVLISYGLYLLVSLFKIALVGCTFCNCLNKLFFFFVALFFSFLELVFNLFILLIWISESLFWSCQILKQFWIFTICFLKLFLQCVDLRLLLSCDILQLCLCLDEFFVQFFHLNIMLSIRVILYLF